MPRLRRVQGRELHTRNSGVEIDEPPSIPTAFRFFTIAYDWFLRKSFSTEAMLQRSAISRERILLVLVYFVLVPPFFSRSTLSVSSTLLFSHALLQRVFPFQSISDASTLSILILGDRLTSDNPPIHPFITPSNEGV